MGIESDLTDIKTTSLKKIEKCMKKADWYNKKPRWRYEKSLCNYASF